MSGRRGTFNWASAPDEGDAAAAARDTAEWLAEPRRARDWQALLPQIREHLTRIAASPLVRGDPECRAILDSLRADAGAAALDAAMTRLSVRVDALVGGAPAAKVVPPAPSPAEAPAAARPGPPPRRRLFRL